MSRRSTMTKFAAVAATLAASTALSLAVAAPASALTANKISICAQGDYTVRVTWPTVPTNQPLYVGKDHCLVRTLPRDAWVAVHAKIGDNNWDHMGNFDYTKSRGIDIYAKGWASGSHWVEHYS